MSNFMYDRERERHETVIKLLDASNETRQQLIEEYRKRSEQAYAPNTLKNYKRIIALFSKWCVENGYSSTPPVSAHVLIEYIDYLGGKVKASTIECRLWAIGEMHRAEFVMSPCRHRLVELAVKGVKRKYGAACRQAPPLGKKDVLEVIKSLDDSRQGLRDKALLWIASDSWCRASEICALKVNDLIRQDDGSSLLFVSRSKTDPYGKGDFAFLSERGTKAALRWIEIAELKADGPLLTKAQKNSLKTHMDPATISRIMKRCTGRKDISSHSTRVGGVQDAFRIGCDISSIMVAGRWSSPAMPALYGRKILASQSAAAQVSAAFSEPEESPSSSG